MTHARNGTVTTDVVSAFDTAVKGSDGSMFERMYFYDQPGSSSGYRMSCFPGISTQLHLLAFNAGARLL